MKKRIIALLTSLALLATITTGAVAASITCTVKGIEKDKVTLSCGRIKGKIKVGDKVKVRKRKVLEGC